MRDIWFRGKSLEIMEWVCGSLLVFPNGNPYICVPFKEKTDTLEKWQVNPATVGQYTELVDKNGVKIFEGDIVHITGNQAVEEWKNIDYNALIVFSDGGFCAIDGTPEEYVTRYYALARMDFELEVIGNVYDNLELLEEKIE